MAGRPDVRFGEACARTVQECLIEEAYRIIGVLGAGQWASHDQLERARPHLEGLLGTYTLRAIMLANILAVNLLAEERERCAKIAEMVVDEAIDADEYSGRACLYNPSELAAKIAAAIRSGK